MGWTQSDLPRGGPKTPADPLAAFDRAPVSPRGAANLPIAVEPVLVSPRGAANSLAGPPQLRAEHTHGAVGQVPGILLSALIG